MILSDSILEKVRAAVGLSEGVSDFDTDLLMHINSSIGELNQNGVGKSLVVTDTAATWGDLQDPDQVDHNDFFNMVPLFIALNTKLLFDPPPPSNVQYHQASVDKLLWRLKIAYENPVTTTTTTSGGDW